MDFRNNRLSLQAVLLTGYGLQMILSLLLVFQSSPFFDNLTGLLWLKKQPLSFVLAFASLIETGLLAFRFFCRSVNKKAAWTAAGSMGIELIGLLIPYSNSNHLAWISSLHLLLCIIGISLLLCLFAWILMNPASSPNSRKTAGSVFFLAGISLCLFSLSGSVNLLCELFFLLSLQGVLL